MSRPYMDLIREVAPLDRCHVGPEMAQAFQQLKAHYPSCRLLSYDLDGQIDHWRLPPSWTCRRAELRDSEGRLIASRARNKLEVFAYSPPVDQWLTWDELQDHLLSDPERPDAILFHFRNQYRHWAPQWGFSIPHAVLASLPRDRSYHALIDSSFSHDDKLVQADYRHAGRSPEEILLIGHYDHPSQVNDGLAGCVAAFEVIRRLEGRATRYSYRAFASVEIVGAVAYLAAEADVRAHTRAGLFLTLAGIGAPLAYQRSFDGASEIDRVVAFLLQFTDAAGRIYGHRELLGNDENVFDSVGYAIPTGTLMRWPFPEYHTNHDDASRTDQTKIEEMIEFTLKVIDVLEHDRYLAARYRGLPSLANPDIDLYLTVDAVSGVSGCAAPEIARMAPLLSAAEAEHVRARPSSLNRLMQNMLRMADGRRTIFDVAEKSAVPFVLARAYASQLAAKGLIELREHAS